MVPFLEMKVVVMSFAILRRASMHGQKLASTSLSFTNSFQLLENHGKLLPRSAWKRDFIEKIVKSEEESFARTLHSGQHFAETISWLESKGQTLSRGKMSSNSTTYGFPVELTEEIAEEAGMTVDREGFEAAMKEQQERACVCC